MDRMQACRPGARDIAATMDVDGAGFSCRHCARPIDDDMAVYMCNDATFCSDRCRRQGRAAMGGALRSSEDQLLWQPSTLHLGDWSATSGDDDEVGFVLGTWREGLGSVFS